jgi:cell division control protein 24
MLHVLRLGSSLCHVYNALIPAFTSPSSPLYADAPAPSRLDYDFPNFMESPTGVRNWAKKPEHAKVCQRYIYAFCTQMKLRKDEGRWYGESWAIHELWGRTKGDESECENYDTTGLMKVFQTVEAMLDHLPDSAMSPVSPTPTTPFGSSQSISAAIAPMTSMSGHQTRLSYPDGSYASLNSSTTLVNVSHMGAGGMDDPQSKSASVEHLHTPATDSSTDKAFKTVQELVNSERSYVQEIEILERFSVEILNADLVSPETVYSIFSNLRQILDFQRKFLIKLETEFEPIDEMGPDAWTEGRWGRPFVDMEKEFAVYGPYCANFMDAQKVVQTVHAHLMMGVELPEERRPCLNPATELQAFMIKPIQRITKYGLLLDAIQREAVKHDYRFLSELQDGIDAVKRVTLDIDETTAYKTKQATVRDLVARVDDWKGHDYERFGDLHLDDQFTVTKNDTPRDYHVFLFEKMMLCCKEVTPDKKTKSSKNNNMLRKDKTASKGQPPPKAKLSLKGRIFVSNITDARLLPAPVDEPFAPPRVRIMWSVPTTRNNGNNEEYVVEDAFIMTGRNEDQVKKWADKIMELAVKARQDQSAQEYQRAHRSHMRTDSHSRISDSQRTYWSSGFAPTTPGTEHSTFFAPQTPAHPGYNTLHDEDDEDDEHRFSQQDSLNGLAIYGVPGVPFPSANRRAQSQQSIPPAAQAELRTRAMTEDQNGPSMTQWRQQPPPLPHLPRVPPAGSAAASDASWGHSAGQSYRRQPSQSGGDEVYGAPAAYNRYDQHSGRGQRQPLPGMPPHPMRSRSTSSPNAYLPNEAPLPPLPHSAAANGKWAGANGNPYPTGSTSSSSTGLASAAPGGTAYFNRRMSVGKRSSQESETTETSETSSGSPRTPYTNERSGDPRGATPVSRQNSQDAPSMVYIKVRSGDANFVISMPSDVSYSMLHEKVVKKLRLCSGRHSSDGLDKMVKIKWLDSDGDEVAIKTDSDVQVMLMECTEGQIQLIAI